MFDLNLADLRKASVPRSIRWGCGHWTTTDWATAMMGEAGEACNAIKKLRRIETGAPNKNDPGRQLSSTEAAKAAIASELAGTLIYLDLLAAHLSIDLAQAVRDEFNKKSIEYDFPERL